MGRPKVLIRVRKTIATSNIHWILERKLHGTRFWTPISAHCDKEQADKAAKEYAKELEDL
jgi:hypothetical protein